MRQAAVAVAPTAVQVVLTALEDGKAEDVVRLDVRKLASFTDEFVIATGRSQRQVAALADRVQDALRAAGRPVLGVEGLPQADWVVVDAGEVVVHVFVPAAREVYNLEKLWHPTFAGG